MIVTILIYMYPLKAIFSSMWFLLSSGEVGHTLGAHSGSQVRALFAVFALGFTAIAAEVVLLNLRAWQLREPLRVNAREKLITLYEVTGWHPGRRRNHVVCAGSDPAARADRMERLDLFLDGRSCATALFLP